MVQLYNISFYILHNHWSFSVAISSSLVNTTSWRLLSLHYNVLDINVREPLRTSVSMLHFSMLRQSPPTYGLALYSLDMIPSCFPWIALMRYNHKICPPDLVSTMVIYSSYTPCDSHKVYGSKISRWPWRERFSLSLVSS